MFYTCICVSFFFQLYMKLSTSVHCSYLSSCIYDNRTNTKQSVSERKESSFTNFFNVYNILLLYTRRHVHIYRYIRLNICPNVVQEVENCLLFVFVLILSFTTTSMMMMMTMDGAVVGNMKMGLYIEEDKVTYIITAMLYIHI